MHVVALPSRPLVTLPSCLLTSPLIVLSMHHPLIVSLCRLVVVASPLVVMPSPPPVPPHSCPLIVVSLAALLSSHRAVWLFRRLSLRCRLVLLSSSRCAALSLSNHEGWLLRRLSLCRHLVLSLPRPLVLSSSRCSLTALPSRRLIAQAGCCLTSCHTAVSSSRYTALSSSCHPLTVPPSRLLIARSGCCIGLVLSSSSHCAALLLSNRAGWLLCCLSLRRPFVLSLPCPLILSLRIG